MKKYYKVEWMTQEFLKETFTYCDSGNLIWRHDRPIEHFKTIGGYKTYMTQRAGIIAGKIAINEVKHRDVRTVQVSFKGEKIEFKVHVLIFLLHHGYVPRLIDHIDGNYFNNKIENLQPLNNQLNTSKATMFSHNTTGYRGVSIHLGKFAVKLKFDGKPYSVGRYNSAGEAASVYNYLTKMIFGKQSFQNKLDEDYPINFEYLNTLKFYNTYLPEILTIMDSRYGSEREFRENS